MTRAKPPGDPRFTMFYARGINFLRGRRCLFSFHIQGNKGSCGPFSGLVSVCNANRKQMLRRNIRGIFYIDRNILNS